MPRLERQGKGFALFLTEEEQKRLGIEEGKELEINRAKQGIWVISEGNREKKALPEKNELDVKIFDLLFKKSLSDGVEGKFESFLSEKELARFRELLAEGKIVNFKLSDKYKKGVYKIAGEKRKESENPEAQEKQIQDYSLEKDGFLVAKNEDRAKRISDDLQEDIREGRIKGIKSFDGNFYIIENDLLEKYREKACDTIRKKNSLALSELARNIDASRMLTRIVCEFLKEDGEIIEKRKELFETV